MVPHLSTKNHMGRFSFLFLACYRMLHASSATAISTIVAFKKRRAPLGSTAGVSNNDAVGISEKIGPPSTN